LRSHENAHQGAGFYYVYVSHVVASKRQCPWAAYVDVVDIPFLLLFLVPEQ
jgi:uncharacterized protein YceK